jgi:nucleoside-diphosphate-sugar epimerase
MLKLMEREIGQSMLPEPLIESRDCVLVTGANGFIGARLIATLLANGFSNVRCFVRPSSDVSSLRVVLSSDGERHGEIVEGNLLSREDCRKAIDGVSVIYHLAAGRGDKSYPNAFLNSVVTTRNLLDAILVSKTFKRFVNVSSFTVYSTRSLPSGSVLDESCEVEEKSELRGEAYCYAKVKQEQILIEYHKKFNIPYVIVRPGAVYGPGNKGLTGRVGIDTFGLFLHFGGNNRIPLTYVDNCADAIMLAGIRTGIETQVFNVVDDDLPRSRVFLAMYKKGVKRFDSVYVPKWASYLFCYLWEKYSHWSHGQLPPVFNRSRWASDWKGHEYSNQKIKGLLGWRQRVSFEEGVRRYCDFCKETGDRNA